MACVGAATPEVAVAIGGYAAVRFGRPLERLKTWRQGCDDEPRSDVSDDSADNARSTATA
jgi:hypothetical protein